LQIDGTDGATGDIAVQLLSNSLEVFPNPSDGNFEAIISSFYEGTAQITLYSNLGKKLFTTEVNISYDNNRFSFNFSAYPTGIYYMKVQVGSETLQAKILIVK
jgi:hypothetical protein